MSADASTIGWSGSPASQLQHRTSHVQPHSRGLARGKMPAGSGAHIDDRALLTMAVQPADFLMVDGGSGRDPLFRLLLIELDGFGVGHWAMQRPDEALS